MEPQEGFHGSRGRVSLTIRKRGRYWYARGSIPARQADGSISRVRIEESTRTESKIRARQVAADIERHYHDLAYGRLVKQGPSFAEAAITYIQTRGKSDHFVTKLIKHFGDTRLDEIDQAAIADAAHTLYPNKSAATHIRAIYTPMVAILSATGTRANYKRPRVVNKPIRVPSEEWFDTILPKCPPKLAALMVFLTLRGRRVGEAIRLKAEDVDWESGSVVIERTKTGSPVKVTLPSLCVEYLKAPRPKGYTGQPSKHLFGYHSVQSAHLALKTICRKHKLPMYGFHSLGRHAFATRLLKAGWSVKHVQEAGGWKSSRVVADRYLHLSKSEVAADVDEMGENWGSKRTDAVKNVEYKGVEG